MIEETVAEIRDVYASDPRWVAINAEYEAREVAAQEAQRPAPQKSEWFGNLVVGALTFVMATFTAIGIFTSAQWTYYAVDRWLAKDVSSPTIDDPLARWQQYFQQYQAYTQSMPSMTWTYPSTPSTTLGQTYEDPSELCHEVSPGRYDCPRARGICGDDDLLRGGKGL